MTILIIPILISVVVSTISLISLILVIIVLDKLKHLNINKPIYKEVNSPKIIEHDESVNEVVILNDDHDFLIERQQEKERENEI